MDCEAKDKKGDKHNYRYRRFLSQLIATTVKNFLIFGGILCPTLTIIAIPALTGIYNKHNQNEFLTITAVQASWLGAISYLVQPIGCFLSVLMTDPLGRKRAMILVNIPFAIGWFILYQSSAVWHIFAGKVFHAVAVGLMEASILTYLGEICEPSFRGILIGYSFIFGTLGVFMTFLLNTLMDWRSVCLIYLTVPIITAISICFIPETPQWLLSKNRTSEAEKSLRWLRGWVSSEIVAEEFNDLKRHSERSKSCSKCIKQDLKCSHPLPTLREKFAEFKRKQTLKPFFIVTSMFFLAQFTGNLSMRPFIVQIFKAYDSPIPADQAVAIMSIFDNVTNVAIMLLIRFTGKRRIYLFCISVVFACTATISWFGFTFLPSGHISFDQATHEPFHLENRVLGYIPMVCLMMWNTFSYCGLNSIPWMLLSEMFPFKSRGIGSGIAAAMHFIFGFISRRTYYNLETTLSLPGVSSLFACICFLGLILTYKILPETENRSLEDIELHFSDYSKRITDRKITSSKDTAKN